MTKYIAENPEQQPIHDMMDDIEIAYRKADKAGIKPIHVKVALQHMVLIYSDEHPELPGSGTVIELIIKAMREKFKKEGN